jgi:hypothetical protein
MKNIRGKIGHALVIAGLIYALVTVVVVPAWADCTQSDCNGWYSPGAVDAYCHGLGCDQGGQVVSCTSSGWSIYCNGCGTFSGTCP